MTVKCIKHQSLPGPYRFAVFGFVDGHFVKSTRIQMLSLDKLFKLAKKASSLSDEKKFILYSRFADFRNFSIEQWMAISHDLGFTDIDNAPLRCWNCGCKKLRMQNSYEDNIMCEQEVKCSNCSEVVGYWAYGNWEI